MGQKGKGKGVERQLDRTLSQLDLLDCMPESLRDRIGWKQMVEPLRAFRLLSLEPLVQTNEFPSMDLTVRLLVDDPDVIGRLST